MRVFTLRATVHHRNQQVTVGNFGSNKGIFVVVGVVGSDLGVGQYGDGVVVLWVR